MKLTMYAIALADSEDGANRQYWTGEDFARVIDRAPRLYSCRVEAEVGLADARDVYGPAATLVESSDFELVVDLGKKARGEVEA
jgi:hypothetical protein